MVSSIICGRFILSRRTPQILPLLHHLSPRQPTTSLLRSQPIRNASKKASAVPTTSKAVKKKTPDALKKNPDALTKKTPDALKKKTPNALTKKTPDALKKKTTGTTTAPAAAPAAPRYFSLAEQLGNSGKKKIILYACDNRLFVVGCYGLAAGMVAWSVYTFKTNIAEKRSGIPNWVVKTTYVSVSIMMLLAVGVAYYPTRLIQVIHAHPIPATARKPARVSITLHRRPILPTLPMKKIEVASPNLITLGEPLHPAGMMKTAPAEEKVEDTRSAATKIRHGVTGAPFKVFDFFRKALSTSGFVLLRAEGVGKFRISKDGWVWEKRGLDMLFRTETK